MCDPLILSLCVWRGGGGGGERAHQRCVWYLVVVLVWETMGGGTSGRQGSEKDPRAPNPACAVVFSAVVFSAVWKRGGGGGSLCVEQKHARVDPCCTTFGIFRISATSCRTKGAEMSVGWNSYTTHHGGAREFIHMHTFPQVF